MEYKKIVVPKEGSKIKIKEKELVVPDDPIIPFIQGDGTGIDITPQALRVLSEAVEKTSKGKKKIVWMEIYAGEKAMEKYNTLLPDETTEAIKEYVVALKGPLTTPVGGGFRSLNVSLRQMLDLYACVRPVFYIDGVPSPMKHPEKMDMVIFREATEDLYAGIEWKKGSEELKKLRDFLKKELKIDIREDAGIGVKPISEFCSKRLVRKAIEYAIKKNRRKVSLMHKGNIMKYTEGAFREWGYEVAKEFGDKVVKESDALALGEKAKGKIIINDVIADNMFQQILTRTDEYDVIATMNINGDFISDAAAAQIGGLGVAPSANIGDYVGLFEATHGTAPKYAGQDKVNPCSVILAGAMMLDYIGWSEAAERIKLAISKTVKEKKVTYDLARQMGDIKPLKTSEFASAVIENL
ncbi:MAG: isocitrate dehydrogenase (NADP(+)) [Candidatus Thermoplasmatota archaeon]